MVLYCVAALLLVLIDQGTKLWAVAALKDQAIVLWSGVFELRYCENTGVAFSMLENQRWVFIPLTLLVVALVLVVMMRSEWRCSRVFMWSMALILAGGVGNLIDRIWHRFVVDFLYFSLINFPIFNFADCCVTIGAVLLFVFVLFINKETEEKPLRTVLFGVPAKGKDKNDGE